MNVAVLGAGAVGLGTACRLLERGHEVRVWSPSGRSTQALAAGEALVAEGEVAGSFSPAVATSPGDAVRGAELVIIAVPGYGTKAVIDAVAPFIEAGQIIAISSHSSFSALYLSKKLAERGVATPINAWSTTAVLGRAAPPTVQVATLRKRIDCAALHDPEGRSVAACRAALGEIFKEVGDLVAITLSNLNPPIHLANAMCNLTRMERGETWDNYACITPVVGRMVEALDVERLATAKAFGHEVRTVIEHLTLGFAGIEPTDVADMSRQIAEKRGMLPGPTTIEHRYITEDVPYGLVPVVMLGQLQGVPMPVHEAGIRLISVMYGRDFEALNDILPELGLKEGGLDRLEALVARGWH